MPTIIAAGVTRTTKLDNMDPNGAHKISKLVDPANIKATAAIKKLVASLSLTFK